MKKRCYLLVIFLCYLNTSFAQESMTPQNEDVFREKIDTIIKEAVSKNFYDAQQDLQEALILANGIKDDRRVANTSAALAKLYLIRGDYSKAEVNMLRAITTYNKLDDRMTLGIAYRDYAGIFLQQSRYDRAQDYLDLAYNIFIEEDLPINRSYVQKDRGYIMLENEMYDRSVNFLDEALPQLQNTTDYKSIAEALLMRSKAHFANFSNDKALEDAQQSMNLSERYKLQKLRADNALMLSLIYDKDGNKDLGYEYLTLSNNINKELLVEAEKLGANQPSDKELKEKDEVITNLSEVNLQQERDIRLNTLITLLSIAFITILSLLTLSLYKNNKIREKANILLLEQRDELKEAKENAEKATKAKAQFLSTITHELRTPLYAVTGLTNLLLEEDPSKSQKQHLNSLKFSGEYLLSLINDILDLNKLEAEKVEIRKDTFNLEKRVNDVIIALKHSAKINKDKIHFEFDDSIPNRLNGDSIKLSQVLINLIGNSIKFTHNGDIWIRLKKVKSTATVCTVNFKIEDNGVGISEEQQKTIFESFSQGSLEINRKFGGTGLGLSIVKHILELVGSEIKLKSELGKGSTFYFDLDFKIPKDNSTMLDAEEDIPRVEIKRLTQDSVIVKDKSNSTKTENKDNSTLKEPQAENTRLNGYHILVVEDNKINQMITRKNLEKLGATCEVADNGEKAVAICEALDFDLVLMDIHMPGISGIEATQQIRAFNKNIPILALTAMSIEDNGSDFLDKGFTGIIPKPYKNEEFYESIETALSIVNN